MKETLYVYRHRARSYFCIPCRAHAAALQAGGIRVFLLRHVAHTVQLFQHAAHNNEVVDAAVNTRKVCADQVSS